ncbi:hypothetical protein DHEL01_v204324, partial [Diaporthe helianthi]
KVTEPLNEEDGTPPTSCATGPSPSGQVKQADAIIGPHAEARRRLRTQRHKFNDALGWFEDASKGDAHDPAIAQLILSLAALHGTTDLICQVSGVVLNS